MASHCPSKAEKNRQALAEAARRGQGRVEATPAVIYLEAAAICNLHCPMCPATLGLPREPYRSQLFNFDLLPKIEPFLPHLSRAFLSGGGEPLLHPRFFDLVRLLKNHPIEIYFNTNATLLDESRARLLLETQVDTISFSVDGATPATYERIRVPASFAAVTANIRRLAHLKEKERSLRPFLNMQFTLFDLNRQDLLAVVSLAADLGINHLVIEPLTPIFNFDSHYRAFYEAHHVPADEALLAELQAAAEDAARLGLVFSSHYLLPAEEPDPPRRCVQPWLTFGVRVDGRVFSCCGTIEQMGDLALQNFDAIWNGPAYQSLRQTLAAGRFPPFCSWCIAENRAPHFNEDLLSGRE